jgi:hypothetical protein
MSLQQKRRSSGALQNAVAALMLLIVIDIFEDAQEHE